MKRTLALALFALALAATPIVAIAAPPAVEWQRVDVTMHQEQGHSILIISGSLPEGTKLPATVQLSAPKGGEIQWAGEILGTGVENDIEAKPQKTEGKDFDTYSFTLTKAPIGQIEVVPPAPATTTSDAQSFATTFAWTPPTDVETVRMNALVPAGAQIANESEGAQLIPGGDASTNYVSKQFMEVKAGEPLELAFNYTVVAAPAAPPASSSSSPAVAIALLAVGALFVGTFIAIRRKTQLVRAGALQSDESDESVEGGQAVLALDASDTAGDVATARVEASEAEDGEEDYVAARPSSRAPKMIAFGVIGVIMVFGAMASYRSVAPQTVNGTVTRTFGTGDECAQASIIVKPNPGVDLARSADDVLGVFSNVPGVAKASLNVAEGRVEIGYCGSSATEESLKQALASSGLVVVD
ncbi:MAG: hypothetical protein U1E26_08705 [Coriobacteriia bacterium]|nr:hypothetical protein [Coriobacteriia bacterium]